MEVARAALQALGIADRSPGRSPGRSPVRRPASAHHVRLLFRLEATANPGLSLQKLRASVGPSLIVAGPIERDDPDYPSVLLPAIRVRLVPGVQGTAWQRELISPRPERIETGAGVAGTFVLHYAPLVGVEITEIAGGLMTSGAFRYAEPLIAEISRPHGDFLAHLQWERGRMRISGAHEFLEKNGITPGAALVGLIVDEGIAAEAPKKQPGVGRQSAGDDIELSLLRLDPRTGNEDLGGVDEDHGLHVAGLFGARGTLDPHGSTQSGFGIVGVAPGARMIGMRCNWTRLDDPRASIALAEIFAWHGGLLHPATSDTMIAPPLAQFDQSNAPDVIVCSRGLSEYNASDCEEEEVGLRSVGEILREIAIRGRFGRGACIFFSTGNEKKLVASAAPYALSPFVVGCGATSLDRHLQESRWARNSTGCGIDLYATTLWADGGILTTGRQMMSPVPGRALAELQIDGTSVSVVGTVLNGIEKALVAETPLGARVFLVDDATQKLRSYWVRSKTETSLQLHPSWLSETIEMAVNTPPIAVPGERVIIGDRLLFPHRGELSASRLVLPLDDRLQAGPLALGVRVWEDDGDGMGPINVVHCECVHHATETVLSPVQGSFALGKTAEIWLSTSSVFGAFGETSAAAPLCAGVAALVLSVDPTLTSLEVAELLRSTGERIGKEPDVIRRVDALAAVKRALNGRDDRSKGKFLRDLFIDTTEGIRILNPENGRDTSDDMPDGSTQREIHVRVGNRGSTARKSLPARLRAYLAAQKPSLAGHGWPGAWSKIGDNRVSDFQENRSWFIGDVVVEAIAGGGHAWVSIPWAAGDAPPPGVATDLLIELAPHDGAKTRLVIGESDHLAGRALPARL